MLAIVVLGGMGSQFAVILAAVLLVVSRELMRDLNEYSMLMLGGLMVLMMIWRPQGLLPMTRPQLKLKKVRRKESRHESAIIIRQRPDDALWRPAGGQQRVAGAAPAGDRVADWP